MLATINHNTVEEFKYKLDLGLESLFVKKFSFFTELKINLNFYLLNKNINSILEIVVSQLYITKGLKLEIELHKSDLLNTNLNSQILHINKSIKRQIIINSMIEKIAEKSSKFPLKKIDTLLEASEETLSTIYDIQRLLKKMNLKPALSEQSELAMSSIKRSQNSLQVIYG
jgi:hypothetical protein